jgi:hypothetical protein
MIINYQGVTSRKHEAMRVKLLEDHSVLLKGSSALWLDVEGNLDEATVTAIQAIDVTTLEEEPEPLTAEQRLAQIQFEFELQAEIMSEMMEVLSVL